MEKLENFGKLLKSLRKERGLTLEDLAALSGLSIQSISHYETGKNEPNYKSASRLLDVFGYEFALRELRIYKGNLSPVGFTNEIKAHSGHTECSKCPHKSGMCIEHAQDGACKAYDKVWELMERRPCRD